MRAARPTSPSARPTRRRLLRPAATAGLALVAALAGVTPAVAHEDGAPASPAFPGGVAAAHAGAVMLAGRAAYAPTPHLGVAVPRAAVTLPSAVEVVPAYVPQKICDPVTKPGVAKLRNLLLATYPDSRNLGTATGCTGRDHVSEHLEGRAFDFGLDIAKPQQKAEAETFLAWLTANDGANARRMGVMYVMWDAKIWGTYSPSRGWRTVSCSGKTDCHRDHIHLSMTWDGAYARTSFWTGRVAVGQDYGPCVLQGRYFAPLHPATARNTAACPTWRPLNPKDQVFPTLRAQAGRTIPLTEVSPGTKWAMWILGGENATGRVTPLTKAHLSAFQLRNNLPVNTTAITPATWRALVSYTSGGAVLV